MKKSIKYAGIAAATLLAVAPIAAPVVSSTTVQAATNATTDQSEQQSNVDAWIGQFANTTAKKMATADATSAAGLVTPNQAETLAQFDVNNKGLVSTQSTDTVKDMINSKADASVTVTAKAGDTILTTSNDVQKYLLDDTKPEVDFTITLTWYDLNGAKKTSTATVKATRPSDTNTELKQLNASFTTPINVPLNSTVTNTQLTGTTGLKLTDQNGDGVFVGSTTVSDKYYATYADAMSGAEGTDAATTGAISTPDDDSNDVATFVKAGTYYQAITFNASNNTQLAKFISQYKTDPSTYSVYVNGKVAAPGYDFVSSAATTTTPATITFVRAVKVSNTTSDWSVSSVDGVVTTKSDSAYYTLKNNDNATVKNRALAANTAWKADKVRTDQFGNKQYRVATGEWIDADNVTFGETATDNNNNSASGLTDVQSVKGVVSVGTPGFTYLLYSKDGKLIKNRALAGGTDWAFINTAKDSDGTTYYRVATDEWVAAGNGVTVK